MVLKPDDLKRFVYLICLICFSYNSSYAQLEPCSISTTSTAPDGAVSICTGSTLFVMGAEATCNGIPLNVNVSASGECQYSITIPCCSGSTTELTWTEIDVSGDSHNCSVSIGIGNCGPDGCEQQGETCSDGNPNTIGDTYDENCVCIGTPITKPCDSDMDGDGVCDEDDCHPQDPMITYGPTDRCDDGDAHTVNDVYTFDCDCVGDPNPCDEVDPDDGCHLTIDILLDNCTVKHLLPDIDDGCEGTYDYFDEHLCEIIHESLPCDDGNPNTVGDKYDENCECNGCDPCELEGEEWELLCELLKR